MFDNRYQLLRKLGEGGYSEVWLVDDTKAGMELVLKIFLPDAQLDDNVVDIFRKEFKLVYNINHPNLLKYSSFEVCMGYPYLKMPYYCSGSAESLIGHCSEQLGWRYLCDVSGGLAFLHSRRPAIIHQDIKPANILIDGDNFIITDFGISSSVYSLFKGTNDRTVVQGTRPYMPPEKYLETPEIYVENDIWSLGASLYELLTGELPFGSKGGATQLEKIEIPELPATFSREMRYMIRKCLSINPSYRPTAKELAAFAKNQMDKKQVPPHRPPLPPSYSPYKTDDFYGQEKKIGYWILIAASCIVGMVFVVLFTIFLFNHIKDKDNPTVYTPVSLQEPDSQLTNRSKTDNNVVIDNNNDKIESTKSILIEEGENRKKLQLSPSNKKPPVLPKEKKIEKSSNGNGENNDDSEGESSIDEFYNQHTSDWNYTSGKRQ